MYLLNYIYFLIITLLGLKFLTMKRGSDGQPAKSGAEDGDGRPGDVLGVDFFYRIISTIGSRSIRFDGYSLNGIRDLLHSGPVYL